MPIAMNPFIVNYFKALMKQSGEAIPEDPQDRRFEDLYRLFESMLGKSVLAALPTDKQSQYMAEFEKDPSLSFEMISEIFGDNVGNPDEILKKTMSDFSKIYFKNREKGEGD
ncbi:DUF5663 domain-containing protein [Acidobacteriota bacterium]